MSGSSSVLSRVRMFEQQGTKSNVPCPASSSTPRSEDDVGENASSPTVKAAEASPSKRMNGNLIASRYQNALDAQNRTPDVPRSTGSKGTSPVNKRAGPEVVGWPSTSSDDEDGISPPKLTEKTPTAWSASGPLARKQSSIAARYQQAISSQQIESPKAVTGRTGSRFVDCPSPIDEEEGIPPAPNTMSAPGAPSPRGDDSVPRTARFRKVPSSSWGKSPNAQSGNELVGWPSEEDGTSSPVASRSSFNKLSSFKARSESGAKAPLTVKSPNAQLRKEIAAWPPSKQTETILTPSPVSRSSDRSVISETSPRMLASPPEGEHTAESSSPVDLRSASPKSKDKQSIDEISRETKSSKFSRAAKLQARKMYQVTLRDENSAPESMSLDSKGKVSVGESSLESKSTSLSHSTKSQSKIVNHRPSASQQLGDKDYRGLKQSLDDAAVVLIEERSSVGSVSSSQRSSLSATELSSIARRAMTVASSEAVTEDRPPSTITTRTKKSARNLKSALERVKGKNRADTLAPSDDSSTIVISETNESGKKPVPAKNVPSGKPPPPRSERLAAAMRFRSRPSLNQSGSDEVSVASRELTASCSRSPVNLPTWFVEQQGSEDADNGTFGSETTSKTRTSSRRQVFSQAQRRLAKWKGGSTDEMSLASGGSSDAVAKKKPPLSIQPDERRGLPTKDPQVVKNGLTGSDPENNDATHGSVVVGQTSEVSFAARNNIMKKFGVSLTKSESEDASKSKEPLCNAPMRVSDHPAYRQRQSPSRSASPVQGGPASRSTTPENRKSEDHDSVSPPCIASSTDTASASESSDSAWKVPALSSSTSLEAPSDLPRAQSKDSTTPATSPTGKSATDFAPFDASFDSNPFRDANFDFSAQKDTEFDGSSVADPPSTLIGQFHVGSLSDEGSQSKMSAIKSQHLGQVGQGGEEDKERYTTAFQRPLMKEEEPKPVKRPVLHNDKKGAVRWWQKSGAKDVDGLGVSASSSSSIGLSEKSPDDLFDGLDADTVESLSGKLSNGVDGIFTHSSDESSGTNEEAESEREVAPMAVNPSSSDSAERHAGSLERARLQSVNSDITSSILGGEQREAAGLARPDMAMAEDAAFETKEEVKDELIETQKNILVVDDSFLSEHSKQDTDEDVSQYSAGDLLSTSSASKGEKGGYGRLEGDDDSPRKLSRPSIFMKLGLGMLDSFTTSICKPPGVKPDELVHLSPEGSRDARDDQDELRKEDQSAENGHADKPFVIPKHAVSAVLTGTYSGGSAASAAQASMNAQEQKVWSEWDKKESKELTRSSEQNPLGLSFQKAEQDLVDPSKQCQSPPEQTTLPSTPLSHSQRRILEKFSSTLKNHGLEVLKLNRHTKWETRYLTVSKEVHWLNAGESNRLSGDRGQCPLGMLWLKRFNAGKRHSVELIKDQGRGGFRFSHLTKVSAASRTEVNYPTSGKLQEKFKDSVPVIVECQNRSLTFLCKTTDEAHFLCTGLRVVMDVLKREREFMFDVPMEQGDLHEM